MRSRSIERFFAELNGKLGALQSSEVLPRNERNNGAKQNSISGLLSMRNFPSGDEIDHEVNFHCIQISNRGHKMHILKLA